jgi:hopanoid-associated phosphorylase
VTRLIAATGLKREAGLLAGAGVLAIPGGGRSAALEAALLLAAAEGARGLISIGLAGALVDGLSPGDWVVADQVLFGEACYDTDGPWRESLLARLPGATAGAFLGCEQMMTDAAEKRRARLATGAIAVDMESHVAARVALRMGLPFAAARVVSDAADRSLPAAVTVGMRPDGGMALAPVLAALARCPGQLPSLIRTGRDADRAFRALQRARGSWEPPGA